MGYIEIVEYKVKEQGTRWEDTPVFLSDPCHAGGVENANLFATFLSRCHGAEVRWNYQDSSQGHYVGIGATVK